jgi:beta-phosphoglucomutase-like phosphatase (HAD superfamily)
MYLSNPPCPYTNAGPDLKESVVSVEGRSAAIIVESEYGRAGFGGTRWVETVDASAKPAPTTANSCLKVLGFSKSCDP